MRAPPHSSHTPLLRVKTLALNGSLEAPSGPVAEIVADCATPRRRGRQTEIRAGQRQAPVSRF